MSQPGDGRFEEMVEETRRQVRHVKPELALELKHLNEYVTLSNDMWRVVEAAWNFIKSPNGNGEPEYDALLRRLDHYFELYPEHLDRIDIIGAGSWTSARPAAANTPRRKSKALANAGRARPTFARGATR